MNLLGNEKILIVRLTAVGDCVHTIPIACAIKKEFPQEKYDIAIDSQELLKSALVSFSSNAKYRLAHRCSREFSDLFANQKLDAIPIFDTKRHVIERNIDFVRFLGIKNPEIDFVLPKNSQEDENYVSSLLTSLNPDQKTLVISPSTTWETKFWTQANWAKVLDDVNGHMNIVVTGGNSDVEYVKAILDLSQNNNVINLTGKTNLLQLKILFENSDIVLTPDSGSAHLAVATKQPTVICLCGPT